ncbi:MAG: hypothetical protein HY077_04390 [Elusimicrobia bacterium]|nr:hypothetical protein [Elusimicrobiota bacterium]
MIKRIGLHALLLIIASVSRAEIAPSDWSNLFDGPKTKGATVLFAPPTTKVPPAKPVRVGQSDWYAGDPDEATDDKNPSSGEKTRFEEGLQKSLMDACRGIDLTVHQETLLGGVLGIGGRVGRSLQRFANGKLAYIDEFSPRVGIGYAPVLWSGDPALAASVYVGADFTGQSVVIRHAPKGVSSCKQLLKQLDVRTYKTVLPAKAKRIHDMEVGELWKMGLAFKFGFQPAVTAGTQYVAVTLYWGAFHENRENLSIYKMDESKLRLRLRLDRADIGTKGGAVVGSLMPGQLGAALGEEFVAKTLGNLAGGVVNRAVAHQIANYLRAAIDISDIHRTGEQIVLEFILDPNDPAQMEKVANLMKGDFLSLKALAKLVHPKFGDDIVDEQGRLDSWKGDKKDQLGKEPTFAGIDKYKRDGKGFHLKIPIIWDHHTTWNKSDEKITLQDKQGNKIRVYATEKRGSNKFLEIPLLGHLTAHDKWRSAQTFTSRDKDGKVQTPAVMYVHQEGFQHETAASAHDMAKGADDVMKLAGVHGKGTNERTTLPVDALFPLQPPTAPRQGMPGRGGEDNRAEPTYKSAIAALTVVFNQKAVQDVLHASADEIVKCYYNAKQATEGVVLTDLMAQAKAEKTMDRPNNESARDMLASMASTAAKIVKDITEAAAAKTPEEQAEKFSRILSGAGKSGLAYENILKVLVQLIDPLDISAEFYARTNKHIKGEKDVKVRYVLNDRKVADDKLLGQMLEARKRFVEPTKLTD